MPTESPAVQRAVATDVNFSIGLLSIGLDVAPVRRPNLTKEFTFPLTCPEHDRPTPVKEYYQCEDGHLHREGECGRAWFGTDDDADEAVALTKGDIDLIRCGELADKTIELHVHPAADVEAATIGDESAYRCRPAKKAGAAQRKIYSSLLALAGDPQYALLTEFKVRGGRRLYRLRVHRGQLLLQSLIYPSDLAPTEDLDIPTLERKEQAAVTALLKSAVEPFDPMLYGHDQGSALAAVLKAREADPVAASAPTTAAETGSNVLELLEASLKKQKKIATPSRTPRKATPRPRKAATRAKKKAS